MRPIVAVVGPTASGKTGLSLDIAERFGGEIVNADSVQVYRLLDIGSAKPTAEEQARAPHHLVDVVDPDQPFTAADFAEQGHSAVADIHGRGALPVVVGGTALYVRALLRGLCPAPPRDDAVREELNRHAAAEGWPALHTELATVDPEAAARIHPNDRVRIERALEVFRITGRPITEFQREHAFTERRYRSLVIGLRLPRDVLDARIEGRARVMMRAGWIAEVEAILARGYDADLKPLQAIGYREVVALVRGECSEDEAVARIEAATRRFSRRQMTWFDKEPDIVWHDPRQGLDRPLERRITRFLYEGEDV